MKKSQHFTNYLVTIPLVSLSIIDLNWLAIANPPQNSRTQLVAQQTTCSVVNIQTGQLALRFTPNGKSRAGLDNGNSVALLREGSNPWVYVRVLSEPNSSVNGLEGWVNSNYLSCSGASNQGRSEDCSVINIQSGQLALRFTPNGRSRAGLNNGNTLSLIKTGPEPWVYVRVIRGPNSRINGLEGWVNYNYLNCE
ncbi:MAG: SH3 domain-containing protein [Phormidium sp.]